MDLLWYRSRVHFHSADLRFAFNKNQTFMRSGFACGVQSSSVKRIQSTKNLIRTLSLKQRLTFPLLNLKPVHKFCFHYGELLLWLYSSRPLTLRKSKASRGEEYRFSLVSLQQSRITTNSLGLTFLTNCARYSRKMIDILCDRSWFLLLLSGGLCRSWELIKIQVHCLHTSGGCMGDSIPSKYHKRFFEWLCKNVDNGFSPAWLNHSFARHY